MHMCHTEREIICAFPLFCLFLGKGMLGMEKYEKLTEVNIQYF